MPPASKGDRQTLAADAVIPAVMALVFLGLLIYFRSIGGYKAVHLEGAGLATGCAAIARRMPPPVSVQAPQNRSNNFCQFRVPN